jgi:hypothetical protein
MCTENEVFIAIYPQFICNKQHLCSISVHNSAPVEYYFHYLALQICICMYSKVDVNCYALYEKQDMQSFTYLVAIIAHVM